MEELELQFFSPEGQMLDSLVRGPATGAISLTTSNGVFVTYRAEALSRQILIWADYDGTITREDTLDLNNIAFAYYDGRVVIVEYALSDGGATVNVTLRPYADDGSPLTPEPLHSETFPSGFYANGVAFDYADGQLRMLVVSFQPGSTPTTYSVRLVRHSSGGNTVCPAFNPGPFPSGYFATHWTIAAGPWNTSVFGFMVTHETDYQMWLEGMFEDGQSTTLVHIVSMPANSQLTARGIRVVVWGGTVYALYTISPYFEGGPRGAYLTGFPQEEILAAENEFHPSPSSFSLSAYPNPFNATVRLDYSVAGTGPVTLTVFDLTGREVGTLVSGLRTAGNYSVPWAAENLPSGIYLARLTAGNRSQVQKLVLLK